MSLTREELEEIWYRIKAIEKVNKKLWNVKHYRWANAINWELQHIKKLVQSVIGQME